MVYQTTHEDISIASEEAISWVQKYDSSLNYDDLNISLENYADYRPTKLQFHLNSAVAAQSITLTIPYANRLSRTHAKHAIIAKYDKNLKQWVKIDHTLDEQSKALTIQVDSVGIYSVFVNHYWYTSLTQRMADEYPNWTKIRNKQDSTGQLFLNYFGIELETIQEYLEWIQEQKYISTMDMDSLDWIFLYSLPAISSTDTVQFLKASGTAMVEVPILETMKEFFYNDSNDGGLVDYDESKLYTTKAFGRLVMNLTRDGVKTSHALEPTDYHLWNAMDEFGLLVGVSRQHQEKNRDFKERILDAFRYPSGTHDLGLTYGIARELNLVQRKDKHGNPLLWKDDRLDLLLNNTSRKRIDCRTLRIDDQPISSDQYEVDEMGNIRVYALNQGEEHTISFVVGIEKYELFDMSNEDFYQMIFQNDGQATPALLTWVEYINTVAPVMWDRFNWDEGFWDTIDKQLTGLGFVPNVWDSNIEVWKDYVFDSDR